MKDKIYKIIRLMVVIPLNILVFPFVCLLALKAKKDWESYKTAIWRFYN